MVGELDAGNPHVQFDEGAQETCDSATRLAGGCGTGLTVCCRSPAEESAGACDSTSGPRSRRGQSAPNKNRPWSWARPAARAAPFGAAVPGKKRERLKDLFPQPPRIAVHRMPDPRLHRLIHRFPVDEPRVVIRVKPAEPPPETDHVRPHQPRVCGEQPKAEERETVAAPMNTALTRMQSEAKAVEELADLAVPFVEVLLAVGKQQEVIHVSCIGAGTEIADD
jgi:hypothetical protein